MVLNSRLREIGQGGLEMNNGMELSNRVELFGVFNGSRRR
jgi:hypothetical protein